MIIVKMMPGVFMQQFDKLYHEKKICLEWTKVIHVSKRIKKKKESEIIKHINLQNIEVYLFCIGFFTVCSPEYIIGGSFMKISMSDQYGSRYISLT